MYFTSLEQQISIEVARTIKEGTGRGPTNTSVFIHDNYVLIKVTGYVLPNEVKLAETDQGFLDVKYNRVKWVNTKREIHMEKLSAILNKQVTEFYYDVNPRDNTGVLVFFYK